MVAVYAGIKTNRNFVYPPNMTNDEMEDHHKNLLTFDEDLNLDIPPHLDSVVNYRATLGHKVEIVNTSNVPFTTYHSYILF